MKFDKETVIVIAVTIAILIAWSIYYPKYQASQNEKQLRIQQEQALAEAQNQQAAAQQTIVQNLPQQQPSQQTAVAPVQPTATPQPPVQPSQANIPAVPEPVQQIAVTELKNEAPVLKNDLLELTLNSITGSIEQVKLLKFRSSSTSEPEDCLVFKSYGKSTFQTNIADNAQHIAVPVVTRSADGQTVSIVRYLKNFKITQTFSLKDGSYQIPVSFRIQNTDANPVHSEIVFWTAGMPSMSCVSEDATNTPRQNVDYCLAKNDNVESFSPDTDDDREDLNEHETKSAIRWISSTNKYFASFLFPQNNWNFSEGLRLEQTLAEDRNGKKCAVPSLGGVAVLDLAPGETKSFDFIYYCGPKELKVIDSLPEKTAIEAMHIAYWSWFEFIARPMSRFLVWLNRFIGNFGISIILLTLIVRGILWPITQKANNSMRRMQKVQPKIKELREKYKDNPQEMNMRMMELYKEEKINPLGGCLPLLLQLPIFFALYSVFDSSVELRHVAFLWAKDLAQPDQVGPTFKLLGFTLAIHPLILMQTALMVVQQKMTPQQGDPMQQKMMMAMPIIMLVMLYWLPSGLTLYWTVSQLFSIIQMKYGQYVAAKEESLEKSSGDTHKKKN